MEVENEQIDPLPRGAAEQASDGNINEDLANSHERSYAEYDDTTMNQPQQPVDSMNIVQ